MCSSLRSIISPFDKIRISSADLTEENTFAIMTLSSLVKQFASSLLNFHFCFPNSTGLKCVIKSYRRIFHQSLAMKFVEGCHLTPTGRLQFPKGCCNWSGNLLDE